MQHIRFAGLASKWDAEYAKAYSDKLHEMGFSAKPLELTTDKFIVAYAHRPFTRDEVEQALDVILAQKGEGEPPETAE
jgi:hypothetical protein